MAAAIALAGAQPTLPAAGDHATADARIFAAIGYIELGDEGDDAWFHLTGEDQRFVVPAGDARETIWRLLAAAADRGVALRIRYDATAGRLDADGAHVIYPLCSIATGNGASYGDEARSCPRHDPAAPTAEGLLALGLAQLAEHPQDARQSLTDALAAAPALPSRAQAVALRGRGRAAEYLAEDLPRDSDAHDRLLADALADFRRLAGLVPDRPGAQFQVASALVALGGYPEALALYRTIGRRWPDQAFDVAVSTGALYRQQGDYTRALRSLDDFARHAGSEEASGMRFHYHRAWTLILLGRYQEALADLAAGMETQPDYPAAFRLRSCAHARLGRIGEALADQQRALELLNREGVVIGASAIADRDRSQALVDTLQRAFLSENATPLFAPCEGFWDRYVHPRARSPLLGAPGG
jgi:tetratricopeptide (TPR) repeat protein